MPEKPGLMEVRKQHGVESRQLAEMAGIPLRVEYVAEIGGPIEAATAHQLLRALNRLTGQQYTLETVQIYVKSISDQPTRHLPTL